MPMQVKSFQVPGWLAPVMILLALAFIPVALVLAVALGVLAVGTTVVRSLLPSSQASTPQHAVFSPRVSKKSDVQAIDVEYEIKDQK